MKFSFEQLKSFFGEKERTASELTLSLAIRCPTLTANEIFSMFKVILDNYGTASDRIEDSLSWMSYNFRSRDIYNPRMRHSTYILRNFYLIIDQTEEWIEQLKDDTLLKHFEKECRIIQMKLKDNYRDTILQDKYEIVCEFKELICKRRNELQ